MICKAPFNKEMHVQRLSFLEVCRPARTKSAGSQVCHHDGCIFHTTQWIILRSIITLFNDFLHISVNYELIVCVVYTCFKSQLLLCVYSIALHPLAT